MNYPSTMLVTLLLTGLSVHAMPEYSQAEVTRYVKTYDSSAITKLLQDISQKKSAEQATILRQLHIAELIKKTENKALNRTINSLKTCCAWTVPTLTCIGTMLYSTHTMCSNATTTYELWAPNQTTCPTEPIHLLDTSCSQSTLVNTITTLGLVGVSALSLLCCQKKLTSTTTLQALKDLQSHKEKILQQASLVQTQQDTCLIDFSETPTVPAQQ